MSELQDAVIDVCKKEIDNHRVDKQDIEAFLSSYVFNKYGLTKLKDITP